MNADLDFEDTYQARWANAKTLSRDLERPSLVSRFVALPPKLREQLFGELEQPELAALAYAWETWARPIQRPGADDFVRLVLFLGGRGGGKSVAGIQWTRDRVYRGARSLGLLGPTIGDIERYMLGVHEDEEGLLNAFPPTQRPRYIARDEVVLFHTGAVGYVATAERPEFRGPNLDSAWCDELMKWRHLVPLWDNVEQSTRIERPGLLPQICGTSTPRPRKWLKERIVDPTTLTLVLKMIANPHTPEHWRKRMVSVYGGTRQGREQLEGEVLDDNPEALFRDLNVVEAAPAGLRTVVSIDPAVTTNKQSDETGIIVAGDDIAGHIYVLADLSGKHEPEKWGKISVDAYEQNHAECFVTEDNRAGQLVEANIRAAMERKRGGVAAKSLKVVNVHAYAGRGKYDRAGPVSALHQRGMVHIVGHAMPELEEEMTGWNPKLGGPSPNRLDALVWAVWHLANLAGDEKPDRREAFEGLGQAMQALRQPAMGVPSPLAPASTVFAALPRDPFGGKL